MKNHYFFFKKKLYFVLAYSWLTNNVDLLLKICSITMSCSQLWVGQKSQERETLSHVHSPVTMCLDQTVHASPISALAGPSLLAPPPCKGEAVPQCQRVHLSKPQGITVTNDCNLQDQPQERCISHSRRCQVQSKWIVACLQAVTQGPSSSLTSARPPTQRRSSCY